MMVHKQRVNIKQVAKAAKVSTRTVSRVLNDRPDVAPETRQRVKQIIEQLDYQPSNIARSLTHGRSRTLGVVSFGLEYYGPSRTLLGMEQQANELGFTLLLSLVHRPENHDIQQLLRHMLSQHVDGIIWAVPVIGDNRAWFQQSSQGSQRLPLPIIFIDVKPDGDLPAVGTNNRAGGRLATEHLLTQGYRHIGVITGPRTWEVAQERLLGWQDVLGTTQDSQIFEGDWSAASGERGLQQLMKRYPQMDALFACNDRMALGVLQAAYQVGLRIPEDLAVVGFDNMPDSAYFCPPLTTVQQQLIDQGKIAVRELVGIIETKEHIESSARPGATVLEPQLVIRKSTVAS